MPNHEVFQGSDKQWYFRVIGKNHETLAISEGYTRKRDALNGFATLRHTLREEGDIPGRPFVTTTKSSVKPESLAFDPGCA